jgi:cytochrome bd ubiquinol oxidase subunit II
MNVLAFIILAVMLAAYILTDGYDLGIGVVAPAVARSDDERAEAMRSIGPFWHGNEVWLIAAGGALFALFPLAYASSLSGFYLPFMVVLWLLIVRGMAMQLRGHFGNILWHNFWDAAFFLSSTLLAVVFGVALGNLVRGLPLDAKGYFDGSFSILLNPYALGIGVFSLAALALHGACFAAMRMNGLAAARAKRVTGMIWWVVLIAYIGMSLATWLGRPLPLAHEMWIAALPILSIAALIVVRQANASGTPAKAFIASCAFLATLLAEAATTMFPYIVPALPGRHGLSIYDSTPSPTALYSALAVTIVGLVISVSYTVVIFGRMLGMPAETARED